MPLALPLEVRAHGRAHDFAIAAQDAVLVEQRNAIQPLLDRRVDLRLARRIGVRIEAHDAVEAHGDREAIPALKEIAALVAAPLPTVKARLYRAMTRLRTRLLERGTREEWA